MKRTFIFSPPKTGTTNHENQRIQQTCFFKTFISSIVSAGFGNDKPRLFGDNDWVSLVNGLMSVKKPLVVIDVGHSEKDKGAVSPFPPFTTEWDYNSRIAKIIQGYTYRVETVVVFRDPVRNGYQRLPCKINAFHPDFILSLHCNAATPAAFGTEMIHHPGSQGGIRFASILQRKVSHLFGWIEGQKGDRGIKTPINGRGSTLLAETRAPCVIAEPFFLTNETDHQKGLELEDNLGEAYAHAIDQFAETLR